MTGESSNYELSVNDILEMIQVEVEQQQILNGTDLPQPPVVLPPVIDPNFLTYVNSLISLAETKSHVRTQWPKPLNRFPFNLGINRWFQKVVLKFLAVLFRDQRTVNLLFVQTLKESLRLNQHLAQHILDLQTQATSLQQSLHGVGNHLHAIGQQTEGLSQQIHSVVQQNNSLQNQFDSLSQRFEDLEQKFAYQHESVLEPIQALSQHATTTDQHIQTLTRHAEATDQHIQTFARHTETISEHLRSLTSQLESANIHINHLSTQGAVREESIQSLVNQVKLIGDRVQALDGQYLRDSSYLKSDLAQQKRLITLFLEGAQPSLQNPKIQPHPEINSQEEAEHTLDAFYIALEDEFRGHREDIIGRLKVYLPFLEGAATNIRDSLVLDLGCGRGEWLELLRDSGYTVRGIDLNRIALEQCRIKNLEVFEVDALNYLKSLPSNSVGAITGFHLIEHLPFDVLVQLLDETMRVLQPQGLVIFETPNPQNVLVGSCTFYLDPTHRHPLPSLIMEFLTKNRGFRDVKILLLNPADSIHRVDDASNLANRFNEYFYGPMDYAVVGVKP